MATEDGYTGLFLGWITSLAVCDHPRSLFRKPNS